MVYRKWFLGCLIVLLASCGDGQVTPVFDGAVTRDGQLDDASGGQDAFVDAQVPEGEVSVVVALGHRGRTLVSCGDGTTFTGEHVFGGKPGDHGPYAALGRMVYGNGRFVGCLGWGDPTRIVLSTNGVDWEDLSDEAFRSETDAVSRPRSGCSGVGFDGTSFAFYAGGRVYTSDDARTWRRTERPNGGGARAFRGGAGLMGYVTEGVPHFSEDGGATWYTGMDFDPDCADRLQRGGNMLFHGNRVLVVDQGGPVCVSEDRGRTFLPSVPVSGTQDVTFDGTRYLAVGSETVSFSADGRDWGEPVAVPGIRFKSVTHSPALGYLAAGRNGEQFYRSDNGTEWTAMTTSGTETDPIWAMRAGVVDASFTCPGTED